MAEENILGDLTLRSADLQEGYGTRVPNVQKLSKVNVLRSKGKQCAQQETASWELRDEVELKNRVEPQKGTVEEPKGQGSLNNSRVHKRTPREKTVS